MIRPGAVQDILDTKHPTGNTLRPNMGSDIWVGLRMGDTYPKCPSNNGEILDYHRLSIRGCLWEHPISAPICRATSDCEYLLEKFLEAQMTGCQLICYLDPRGAAATEQLNMSGSRDSMCKCKRLRP